jgi:hypothetical protein
VREQRWATPSENGRIDTGVKPGPAPKRSGLCRQVEATRHTMADALTRIFGEQRPAFARMTEEELIEKIAVRVASKLSNVPKPQPSGENKYVRDRETAELLGVSAGTLRYWRSRRPPSGPPVTKLGKMVLYLGQGVGAVLERADCW